VRWSIRQLCCSGVLVDIKRQKNDAADAEAICEAVTRPAKIHGPQHRPWLSALLARRPTKVAAIALANKIARMAWAMMARGGRASAIWRISSGAEAASYLATTATGERDTLICKVPVSAKPIIARAPISMQIVIKWLLRSLIAEQKARRYSNGEPHRQHRGTFLPDRSGRHKRALKNSSAKFHYNTFPPRYGSALSCGEPHHGPHGEAAMSVVLNDLLLFSCLTALVTGIVIAAATLLI
jgi:hypothetical protein